MKIEELLKGIHCSCGKHHRCDILHVAIERGAITLLTELCKNDDSILIVADENTYAAAGAQTVEALKGKQITSVIFSGKSILIPNETAVEKVNSALTGVQKIIGIGSGVIQDLCKYVSFKENIPYYIVATAPSMDGYASATSSMARDGVKVSLNSKCPDVIIGDIDIINFINRCYAVLNYTHDARGF